MPYVKDEETKAHRRLDSQLSIVELTPVTASTPAAVPVSAHLPVSGPHAGSCGQDEQGSQSPAPVGMAPDPGTGAAL